MNIEIEYSFLTLMYLLYLHNNKNNHGFSNAYSLF